GLRAGDRFVVETPGEVIVSAQSGLPITLPGSQIAEIELVSFFGETPEAEGAIARLVSGNLPPDTTGLRVMEIR
ncbi:MAG TPA: curli production assembly protein CsgG, partial [Brevundimonas sp.]|nr:curli production assembly protein CsgG [Brevundimonas sp.]